MTSCIRPTRDIWHGWFIKTYYVHVFFSQGHLILFETYSLFNSTLAPAWLFCVLSPLCLRLQLKRRRRSRGRSSAPLTSFSGGAGYMCVHGYIDWCNSTAHPILRFPSPFSISVSSLSPMLPQAPLSLPIMLCSSRKSDATWLRGAYVSPAWTTLQRLLLLLFIWIIYCILLWNESRNVCLAGCIIIILPYIALFLSPCLWFFFFFFQWSASCRKQTAVTCELTCV